MVRVRPISIRMKEKRILDLEKKMKKEIAAGKQMTLDQWMEPKVEKKNAKN